MVPPSDYEDIEYIEMKCIFCRVSKKKKSSGRISVLLVLLESFSSLHIFSIAMGPSSTKAF